MVASRVILMIFTIGLVISATLTFITIWDNTQWSVISRSTYIASSLIVCLIAHLYTVVRTKDIQ